MCNVRLLRCFSVCIGLSRRSSELGWDLLWGPRGSRIYSEVLVTSINESGSILSTSSSCAQVILYFILNNVSSRLSKVLRFVDRMSFSFNDVFFI